MSGSAGSTTLTTPQIPSHTHPDGTPQGPTADREGSSPSFTVRNGPTGPATGATGGGGSHDHPFSFSSGSGTFTGSAINLAVKYIDLIRATKN